MDAELDHVGVIAARLDVAAARWEALGFRLTPPSRQRGRLPDRDDDGEWATANRCAVFRRGYLELIGVVDPGAFNPWARFIERFEGIHLAAFRVASADGAYAALHGAPVHAPVDRSRKVGADTMRFRNVFSRDDAHPEGRYIFIEHQTPELLWRAPDMVHPNGACALEALWVVAEDVKAQQARIDRLGVQAAVIAPDAFRARYRRMPIAQPMFAAIAVRFDDRARAASGMEDRGFVVTRGERWFVDAGGFIMEML